MRAKKILKKKDATTSGELIIAVYASIVYLYISCTCVTGRLEYDARFVGLEDWGEGL
jgi:hypothetical protein